MNAPLEIHQRWIQSEADGTPNHDGIYLGVLLPCMERLQVNDGGAQTKLQRALGLVALCHLEVLNGGILQLEYNSPQLSRQTPDALALLGWPEESNILREGLRQAQRGPRFYVSRVGSRIADLFSPARAFERHWRDVFARQTDHIEDLDDRLAAFLNSAQFYDGVSDAVRTDPSSFTIIPGDGSRCPNEDAEDRRQKEMEEFMQHFHEDYDRKHGAEPR